MPKEKKSKPTHEFDSQRETRVLLEQIHSEVKTVSEQHGSLMDKLQEHDQRFDKIESKLEQHDLRFLQMDQKFLNVESRLDHVEGMFDHVEGRLDRIEKVVTGVMSNHETRIKKVEEKLSPI